MKDKSNLLIFGALILLVALSFSYTSYSAKINQASVSKEYYKWDVEIINVEINTNGEAEETKPEYKEGTIVLRPVLKTSEDSIYYRITIKNKGNLTAKLGRTLYNEKNQEEHLILTYNAPKDELAPGEETVAEIYVNPSQEEFIEGVSYTNDYTAIYEYIQAK